MIVHSDAGVFDAPHDVVDARLTHDHFAAARTASRMNKKINKPDAQMIAMIQINDPRRFIKIS